MARPPKPDPSQKISISVPSSLRDWGRQRAAAFGMNFSEFIAYLLRNDREHQPKSISIIAEDAPQYGRHDQARIEKPDSDKTSS